MSRAKFEGVDAWRNNLLVSANGQPKALLANAIAALRSPACSNALAFDEFAHETVLLAHPPWELTGTLEWTARRWTPHDDLLVCDWLQHLGIGVTKDVSAQAVEAVARDCPFHPVLDYLDGIEWDQERRLCNWISCYLGAAATRYHEAVGRTLLMSSIARIRQPGCKVDTVPIIEGAQGIRKSTAVATLFDPWFSDELADFGSKDAALQTRGVWGIEVSELDAMNRSESSRMKAFISRTTDRFRPPYGNRVIESPRSCVFVGTTNADTYLRDETGGRRFLPVRAGKIDIDGLCRVRDQLWAEANAMYLEGSPWWISHPNLQALTSDAQRSRYIGDPWDESIGNYVTGRTEVSVQQILVNALALDIGKCGQPEQNRVARCLLSAGFRRVQIRRDGKRLWLYRQAVTEAGVTGDGDSDIDRVTTLKLVTS